MGSWLDLAWSAAALYVAVALIVGGVALWANVKTLRRVFREFDDEPAVRFPHVGAPRPKRRG